jgi:hypothetical protein
MASHGIDFESLDFVITMEEGLVWAIAPAQSPPPTGLDTIIEALEEL